MALVNELRIAICEDKPEDISGLCAFIEGTDLRIKIDSFTSGEAFLGAFAAGKYDLIFMDIYMRGLSGVDVAERIREADKNVTLAFTTVSLDHALAGYRLGALKYLEKPVKKQDVLDVLELSILRKRTRACVTLLISGKYLDIPLDEIVYFENRNHAVTVHTLAGELRTSQKVRLDCVEAKLPSPPFLRCHYSFIINLDYVKARDTEYPDFILEGGTRAPIARSMQKRCRDAFNLYLRERAKKG